MKSLVPLVALLAAPAMAQDAQVYHASETWPVHVSGRTCTLVQATPQNGDSLSVSYDGAEVTLISTNRLESPLRPTGKLDLAIVFLENDYSKIEYDDGWGSREFTYTSSDGIYRFSTRFAGEKNVRQILGDLAGSKALGFLQNRQAVIDYDLGDIGRSVARLRDCAARTVAAN